MEISDFLGLWCFRYFGDIIWFDLILLQFTFQEPQDSLHLITYSHFINKLPLERAQFRVQLQKMSCYIVSVHQWLYQGTGAIIQGKLNLSYEMLIIIMAVMLVRWYLQWYHEFMEQVHRIYCYMNYSNQITELDVRLMIDRMTEHNHDEFLKYLYNWSATQQGIEVSDEHVILSGVSSVTSNAWCVL